MSENLEGLLRQIVELEDAINTASIVLDGETVKLADALKRKEKLRDELKQEMSKTQRQRVVDEVSGYVAKLSPAFSDEWDTEKLEVVLTPEQRHLIIKKAVDIKAVQQLLDNGGLIRTQLEQAGAVKKRLRSVALLIRPLGEDVGGRILINCL